MTQPALLQFVDAIATLLEQNSVADPRSAGLRAEITSPEPIGPSQLQGLWHGDGEALLALPFIKQMHQELLSSAYETLDLTSQPMPSTSPHHVHNFLSSALDQHTSPVALCLEQHSKAWKAAVDQMTQDPHWASNAVDSTQPIIGQGQGDRHRLGSGAVGLWRADSSSSPQRPHSNLPSGSGAQRMLLSSAGSVQDLLAVHDSDEGDHQGGGHVGDMLAAGHDEYSAVHGYDEFGGPEPGWTVMGDMGSGMGKVQAVVDVLQKAGSTEADHQSALSRLCGVDGEILPEDILSASCWIQLCTTISNILTKPNRHCSCASVSAPGHNKQCSTWSATVQLVLLLTAEACATSPVHAAQLLKSMLPAVIGVVPTSCSEHLQASGASSPPFSFSLPPKPCSTIFLMTAALQLLRSMAQDWHFMPDKLQHDCMASICMALATALAAPPSTTYQGITGLYVLIGMDPTASWLQRLASSANSSRQLVLAAATSQGQPQPDTLFSVLQTAMEPGAQVSNIQRTYCVAVCACALLLIPDVAWSSQHATTQIDVKSRQVLLNSIVNAAAHLADRLVITANDAGHVNPLRPLLQCLDVLAQHQPSLWTATALKPVFENISEARQALVLHVARGLSCSVSGAQLLLSSALQYQLLAVADYSTAYSCQMMHTLAVAMGQSCDEWLTRQKHAMQLATQWVEGARRLCQPQHRAHLPKAVDVLIHIVCVCPVVVTVLDKCDQNTLTCVASVLVDGLHEVEDKSLTYPSVSLWEWQVATAGMCALGPKMQGCLLNQGWLQHWLHLRLPQQLLPAHEDIGLSGVTQDVSVVLQQEPSEEPRLAPLTAVQSALSWYNAPMHLSAITREVQGGIATVHRHQALGFLVECLDPWPETSSQRIITSTQPSSDEQDLGSQAAAGRWLPPADACAVAVRCLSAWVHHPAALVQLDSSTNVRWYLHRLISCYAVEQPSSPARMAIAAVPATLVPTDLAASPAQVFLDHLSTAVTSVMDADTSIPVVWLCPVTSWPEGAITVAVKTDAGMSDALGWVQANTAALQADIQHGTVLDVRSIGMLLQRCVLVAWPGLSASDQAHASEPSWLRVSREDDMPLPWHNIFVRTPPTKGDTSPPSRVAKQMVHATLTALFIQDSNTSMRTRRSSPGDSIRTVEADLPCLPTCDSSQLASWVDTAYTTMGCAPGSDIMTDLLTQSQGDALLVAVGALLGAGTPGAGTPAAQRNALEVLQGLLHSPSAGYVWPALVQRACGSMVGPLSALCSMLQSVLQASEPRLWAALGGHRGVGMSSLMHHVARWWGFGGSTAAGMAGGLAWCGVLPGDQAIHAMILNITCGPDYLVYACVAFLKLVEEDLMHAAQRGTLVQWLCDQPLAHCSLAAALPHMTKLFAQHRRQVLPCLLAAMKAWQHLSPSCT